MLDILIFNFIYTQNLTLWKVFLRQPIHVTMQYDQNSTVRCLTLDQLSLACERASILCAIVPDCFQRAIIPIEKHYLRRGFCNFIETSMSQWVITLRYIEAFATDDVHPIFNLTWTLVLSSDCLKSVLRVNFGSGMDLTKLILKQAIWHGPWCSLSVTFSLVKPNGL